jgi:hypothetical protein
MITKDMDDKITSFTKSRRAEIKGRSIYIQLLNGEKVYGELIKHQPNIFIVKDPKDPEVLKEIHRATIKRFMIVVDGGVDGKSGEPR